MTTASRTTLPPASEKDVLPELHSGDRMSREEFHRIYSQMPEDFRAELVEGIVYVASPLKRRHGKPHLLLGSVFAAYEGATPGVDASDNTTLLLGDEAEPQPDLYLRILPEFGGQSKTSPDDYVEGAPELVAEIAFSSYSLDLHGKRRDYRRYGVLEYVVVTAKEQKPVWVDLKADRDVPVPDDGVVRSRTFPGLWIDSRALFRKDYAALMATLQQGLASPEHAAFVRKLAAAGGGTTAS
jgi:Uma2 family endonuclease